MGMQERDGGGGERRKDHDVPYQCIDSVTGPVPVDLVA